jgi:hypothetical protein
MWVWEFILRIYIQGWKNQNQPCEVKGRREEKGLDENTPWKMASVVFPGH